VFTPDFLGSKVARQVPASFLYECLDCSLRFRYPAPTEEELTDYYAELPSEDLWQHGPDREVWREIRKALERSPDRSVLDVGCFRGDLLAYLGKEWQRFGVELSDEARLVAESRGITILANSIESLSADGQQFGAITLIDVIEHLLCPMEALRKLLRRLQPGGQLVIFTGNTDAWSWRFAGLNYWYSGLPEHVAFFSPRWFQWAAPKLNCRLSTVRRLRYQPASVSTRLDETLKNIAYVAYHRLESLPGLVNVVSHIPVLNRIERWESCWWTSARDHVLVVLTKE
jgi:2-polyprenyl-3-methyl-5-hydroxy-6-metoxy-1,4-benzoquinol methylase